MCRANLATASTRPRACACASGIVMVICMPHAQLRSWVEAREEGLYAGAGNRAVDVRTQSFMSRLIAFASSKTECFLQARNKSKHPLLGEASRIMSCSWESHEKYEDFFTSLR